MDMIIYALNLLSINVKHVSYEKIIIDSNFYFFYQISSKW